MKPVVYHRLAESEMIGSAVFYEERRPFLGNRLVDAIEEIETRKKNPTLGKPGKSRTRSWKVRRFPFRVVYLEQEDQSGLLLLRI